ncbi:MAG: nucleotidyltransferase family protein, partial [Planctomycetota bacterium]|nr:nucleotidyltransferase family protein [Planctomycetota bacterium]
MISAQPSSALPPRDIQRDDLLLELVCDLLRQQREASFLARGSSMHPLVRDGDKVTVAPLAPSSLRRGMVVLYLAALPDGGQGMVIHRFLGRNAAGDCLLQGDACPLPDPPVKEEQIIGRVTAVQRGKRDLRLDSWLGRLLLAQSVILPRALARLAEMRAQWRERRLRFLPVTHGRLLRERALLRWAVGGESADEEESEMEIAALAPVGSERDLLPLIYHRWCESGGDTALLPAAANDAAMEALVWSARAEAALHWLKEVIAAAGEEILLVKGAALAWTVYPAPHCRPAADIDILVKPAQAGAVVETLLRAGAALAEPEYTLSFYLRFKNEVALRLPGAGWPVLEIHWRGGSAPWYNRHGTADLFWEKTQPSPFGDSLRIMKAEMSFVFGVAHLAKHFPALRLLWAVDLALLARQEPDWQEIVETLCAVGLALPGAVICRWLEDHLPGTVPAEILRFLASAGQRAGWLERRLFY